MMRRDELDAVKVYFARQDEWFARLRLPRRAAFDRLRSEVPSVRHLSDAALDRAVRYFRTTGYVRHWRGGSRDRQGLLFV